ncbi:MAG: isoprenylcysteine carboxylmethyltransferase family protein [Pseudomonadota bacterium]
MQDSVSERAGIIVPPPVIYLGMLGAGLFFEWIWPIRIPGRPLAVVVGATLLVCGVIGAAAAIQALRRAQTPIDPYKPTTAIVTDGPFRFSRNPIYVSNLVIYVGLSLLLNAWWALALIPALIWVMQVGVISREENYLERKFGADYLHYKRQVRRWL